MTTVS